MARSVLVVGGSGAFGSRLVKGLIATTDFDVVIAGRHLERAEAQAAALEGRARAMRLDTATVTAEMLAASGAFVVADAAGPFQGADYRLARSAIAAGLHYVFDIDAAFRIIGPIIHYRGWLA